jgi:hypothetical protein
MDGTSSQGARAGDWKWHSISVDQYQRLFLDERGWKNLDCAVELPRTPNAVHANKQHSIPYANFKAQAPFW